MTDKGAITQAIKALDKVARQSCAGRNPEGDPYLIEAYDALKAFKDGVPEGLEDEIVIFCKHIHDATSTSTIIEHAIKHLQDGIK